MNVTLDFNLPEERDELDYALKGSEYYVALFEVLEMFRAEIKHGQDQNKIDILEEFRDELLDKVYGLSELR